MKNKKEIPGLSEALSVEQMLKNEADDRLKTSEEALQESFDSLERTVLRVKAERDALLEAAKKARKVIGDFRLKKESPTQEAWESLENAIAQAEQRP